MGDIIDDLGEWFGSFLSSLGGWFSDLFTSIGNMLSSLGDWFGNLFTSIGNLPGLIVDGFSSLLQFLFLPKDGFLDAKISDVQDTLAKKFDMATYSELLKALDGYVSGNLDFGGYIDISAWTKYLPTLKNFIRGFFYPLILIGNLKWIIWLLRGTSPGGSSSSESGGES